MKRVIQLLAILLLAGAAHAQQPPTQAPEPPNCWVVTDARGYTIGSTDAGRFGAWWCPGAWGDWALARLVVRTGYALKHPAVSAATSPASVAEAYWRANVATDCLAPGLAASDPAMYGLCAAAHTAALATRPLPPWIVRPNGSYATRPMYDLVGGVRSKTASGSVLIRDATGRPTACNHAVRVVEGGNVYAQIPHVEPVRVALCSRSE